MLRATQTRRCLRANEPGLVTVKYSSLRNIQQGLHHFIRTDSETGNRKPSNHHSYTGSSCAFGNFTKTQQAVPSSKCRPSWIPKTSCAGFLLTPLDAGREGSFIILDPPKTGAITDVYHLPQCLCPLLGQGHHQTDARVHLLWGEPSPLSPLALSGRATTGHLHARRLHFGFSFMSWCYPGKVPRSCRAWCLCVAVAALDTAITGSPSPFCKLWVRGTTPGGLCLPPSSPHTQRYPPPPDPFRVTAICPDKCH